MKNYNMFNINDVWTTDEEKIEIERELNEWSNEMALKDELLIKQNNL